jgi:hypothetical protein
VRRRALAVAAVLGAAAAGWLATRPVLMVEDLARGRVLAAEPVAAGAEVVLHYVHSSEGVPVRGTLRVEPDHSLRVVETAFAGPGPGLPTRGPIGRRDGLFVHHGQVPLGELRLRIVPRTRHRLVLPSGRALDLSAAMGDGGPVRVRVERTGRRWLPGASASG